MAKVKITGHASGTGVLTVTAPNTSTDRTITLPDATGTLLTADGDGSSLTGVGVSGISSSADATAITIDSSENVGVGKASALGATLHIDPAANVTTSYGSPLVKVGGDNSWAGNGSIYTLGFGYTNGATVKAPVEVGMVTTSASGVTEGSFVVATRDGTTDAAPAKKLEITSDGRGVSPFTARAWGRINQTGTQAISMSHNCSSITDNGTGDSTINFTNAMGSTLYCVLTGNAAENEWSERPNPNVTATGSVKLQNVNHSSTFRDSSRVHFAVYMS